MSGLSRERWQAVSPYLDRALEMTADDRGSWLASLRSEDPTLAADVETLLEERDVLSREGFLEGGATPPTAPASLAGQTIGAYTLVSQIGQGGMGSVWLARRSDGRFEGQVAVKLLNASLVGQAGEQRFRREGNFLGRLTHPHIAHLIDAGVSPLGQPYLVLEHVDGQRIDAYCDEKSLGIERRLRLFLDVLAAVAHAHANLIVHRDIKPSNVLVGADGRVKLLDFGIAKLLESESPSGEATALTREGGAVLTPEYAAPEQVTGAQVTTATDVYALGVLLYVLLVGRHPAGERTHSAADLLRAIVDTEPGRLSDAVAPTRTETAETVTQNAARRSTTPDKLRRLLQGDLDTIVAKALKKNPQERYSSVTALADDLRRFLDHEPISARPDTFAYRATKLVRRHRLPVALASLVLLALVAGLTGTLWQAREAARQRDLALAQLVRAEGINEFTAFLIGEAVPAGKPVTTLELIALGEKMVDKRFADDEVLGVQLLVEIGDIYEVLEQGPDAQRVLKRAYEAALRLGDAGVTASATCKWARTLALSGDYEKARPLFDTALGLLSEEPRFDGLVAGCLVDRGFVATTEGDAAATLQSAQMALDRLQRTPTAFAATRANALQLRALAYDMQGNTAKAEREFSQALQQLTRIGREQTNAAAALLHNWALTRVATDTLGALELQERAIDAMRSADSTDSVPASMLANQGRLLNRLARHQEARTVSEEAGALARKNEGALTVATAGFVLARACRILGDLDCARKALREADAATRSTRPPGHFYFADLSHEQGMLALGHGDAEAARRHFLDALPIHEKASEKHVSHIETLLELARLELQAARGPVAETHARAALELARSLQGESPHSCWVGLSQLMLGEIKLAQQDRSSAGTLFSEALVHLEPTLGESHPATQNARSELRFFQ